MVRHGRGIRARLRPRFAGHQRPGGQAAHVVGAQRAATRREKGALAPERDRAPSAAPAQAPRAHEGGALPEPKASVGVGAPMYRNETLARETQLDALRGEFAALKAHLAAAEREREEAIARLERIRDGVEVDPALETDPRYRRLLRGLRVLGAVAGLAILIGLVPLLSAILEAPLITAQGVRNFSFHILHGRGLVGLAAAGFVVMLASPWLVLPLLSARGLARHRRSGWTLGVVACVLFLPTPLLPGAVYGLVLLFSNRVKKTYFAR